MAIKSHSLMAFSTSGSFWGNCCLDISILIESLKKKEERAGAFNNCLQKSFSLSDISRLFHISMFILLVLRKQGTRMVSNSQRHLLPVVFRLLPPPPTYWKCHRERHRHCSAAAIGHAFVWYWPRHLQRIAHPLALIICIKKEHTFAVTQQSAWISKAFHTLQDPFKRAKYSMLQIAGHEATMDVKTSNDNNPKENISVMVYRAFYWWGVFFLLDHVKSTLQRLSESFRQRDHDRVKKDLVKLQYWQNIQQVIQNWGEGEGEPGKRIEMDHYFWWIRLTSESVCSYTKKLSECIGNARINVTVMPL